MDMRFLGQIVKKCNMLNVYKGVQGNIDKCDCLLSSIYILLINNKEYLYIVGLNNRNFFNEIFLR